MPARKPSNLPRPSFYRNEDEFLKQTCRWADSTSLRAARKWYRAIQEVITRELFIHKAVAMPGIGTFRAIQEPAYKQTQYIGGKKHVFQVPAHLRVEFEPYDNFTNDVNMEGVTKEYRKREKKGIHTRVDYIRDARAECVAKSKIDPANRDKYEKEFRKFVLENSRKTKKGQVVLDDEED